MSSALFVIDVQNDFTEGGALGVEGGAAVAAGITRLLLEHPERYDHVFASRDWHDGDNDNGGHFGETPDFVDTWPVHCVAGTHGAEYHAALTLGPDTIHVRKGQGEPAYSIFEGTTDSGESVQDALSRLHVTSVDVVGIATDYCVLASALGALGAGCEVRVFTDLIAGVAPESSASALESLAAHGAVIAESPLLAHDDADSEFEELGDAHDVEPVRTRGQGLRLGVALVLAGLAIGSIVAVGATVVGDFSQTEAGLCRITWASCTELSLGSVEALSGLKFPEGTEVVSGFSRESLTAPEFRAEVVLPKGSPFSLTTAYGELDGAPQGLVPAVDGRQLTDLRYWSRFQQVSGSTAAAVQGIDAQGRAVILFDTHGLE